MDCFGDIRISFHEHILPAMTIKEAQEAVDQWIREYGVRYFSELTNMAVLTEEVGELARVIANMVTKVSRRERQTTSAKRWQMCFGFFYVWQTRRVLT